MIDRKTLIYNALDAAVTLDCADQIFPEVAANGYQATYNLSHGVFPSLIYIATRGILVDKEGLEAEKITVAREIEERQAELNEVCGRELNPLSPKDCQSYFYGELGIPAYTKSAKQADGTRKSIITTDDKAMARLARGTSTRPGLRQAKLVQELRALHKLRGTYLEIEFDPDGRMRCSVNPRGTRFSRISTSKTIFGTGMNMQNLPETFKKYLIADPGCLLVELDKARAEWVVVAYLSSDAAMIDVCESGADPHIHTAHQMYRVDKSIIKAENDLIGHLSDPDEISQLRSKFEHEGISTRDWPRTMSMRQAGKKANHGLNYDEAYRTFALTNEIMEAEAKRIIELYHEGYPGIRNSYYPWVQNQLRHDRSLVNCFGRKYKFLDAWGDTLFKAAYAFLPQSSVGDLINIALEVIYNDRDDSMLFNEILMQVHDSILNQYHIERSGWDFKAMARSIIRQRKAMSPDLTYHGRTFNIDTDLKVGTSWGGMREVKLSDNEDELAERLEAVARELAIL